MRRGSRTRVRTSFWASHSSSCARLWRVASSRATGPAARGALATGHSVLPDQELRDCLVCPSRKIREAPWCVALVVLDASRPSERTRRARATEPTQSQLTSRQPPLRACTSATTVWCARAPSLALARRGVVARRSVLLLTRAAARVRGWVRGAGFSLLRYAACTCLSCAAVPVVCSRLPWAVRLVGAAL